MTDIHVPAAAVEPVAKAIYDALPYDGPGEKPAWVPRGNSLKQEECRAKAIAALTAALAAWVECGMARKTFAVEDNAWFVRPAPEKSASNEYRPDNHFPILIIRTEAT